MDSPKDKQPDYTGLQSVAPHDAPEVVLDPPSNLNRSPSMNSPQHYAGPDYVAARKEGYAYYGGPEVAQPHQPPPGYESEANNEGARPQQRTLCGLRRGLAIGILAAVLLLVVIAIVLGAVLGTVLNNGSSTG